MNLQKKEGIWNTIVYNCTVYYIYQENRDIIVTLFHPTLTNVFTAV